MILRYLILHTGDNITFFLITVKSKCLYIKTKRNQIEIAKWIEESKISKANKIVFPQNIGCVSIVIFEMPILKLKHYMFLYLSRSL